MATVAVSSVIADFQRMYREGWSFQWGSAREGCVDCSGAFVYSFSQHGASIYHGSNRIAREYVVKLYTISEAQSQGLLIPGMAAFRSRAPGQSYYDLPSEYKQGGSHYNGDLNDYNHIGLVDEDINYVLNANNPFKRDSITAKWTHVGRLIAINYGISSGSDGTSVTNGTALLGENNGNGTKFGIFGWRGDAAKNLITAIRDAASSNFEYILKQNHAENFVNDLSKSTWSGYKVQNNSNIYNALSEILSSTAGVTYQNMRAESELNNYITSGCSRGLTCQSAVMMFAYLYYRGYSEFANYAASKCSGNTTLDNYYNALMEKFSTYSNDIKSEIKRVYEYVSNLESNGTISMTINGASSISTPTGSLPTDYNLSGGDGSSSAAKYNNWWVLLTTHLGSTYKNPSEEQIWNAHRVFRILTAQTVTFDGEVFTFGYNLASACGILGNMQLESGLSPGALQNGKKSKLPNSGSNLKTLTNDIILGWHGTDLSERGYGLGLIQWDSNTNNNPVGQVIASFAINNSKVWYDGDLQMKRLGFEYKHDKSGGNEPTESGNTYSFWYPNNHSGVTWNQYRTTSESPETCADIFRECRERSSGNASGNAKRRENARYWYNYFINNPTDPWDNGSSLIATNTSPVVATQTTIVASYKGANTDAVKPPNYKQFSSPWGSKVFGPTGRPVTDIYASAGCSVTAMCNVVCVFGSSVKPDTIGNLAISWGNRRISGDGLYDTPGFFKKCAENYGFKLANTYQVSGTAAYERIKTVLNTGSNNKLAIIFMTGSNYSKSGSGHFVVAYKMNGDTVCICDPGISDVSGYERQNASKTTIANSAKCIYVFSKN